MADEKKKIPFHFLKSPAYRTFHVDGAVGGATPNGGVWITLYSERGPIPQMIENEINEDGSLGRELMRETKVGIIRDMECGLIMSVLTAKRLHEWLGTVLADMKKGDDK